MVRLGLLIGGMVLALPASARTAAPGPDSSPEIAVGPVRSVEDGATLTLDDGRQIRLAGLLSPAPPLALTPDTPWPAADAARQALDDISQGRTVSLHSDHATPDRHGRLSGQAWLADGTWLQMTLLRAGRDRLEPTADLGPFAAALLKAEADARRHRRGLWRLAAYAVRTPDHLTSRDTGSFVLVEGRVLSVAPTHDATYLDFAEDWRHGFTVRIPRAVLQQADGFDGDALKDRQVRVRGWLAFEGRPILELETAAALELRPKPRKAPKRR